MPELRLVETEAPTPVVIRLSYGQLSMASHVATMRRAKSMLTGRPAKYGAPNGEGSWEIDINGCCAELAVARFTNLFWCGTVNEVDKRDVGGLVDVRSRSKQKYELILHPDDADETPYVLVWTHAPAFDLIGWIFAKDGKRPEFWSDPAGGRPAYFVPKKMLRPMDELLIWLCDVRAHL